MKIALIQTDIIWNSPRENLKNYKGFLDNAQAAGAELVVFPEMFNTGFSFPTGDLAREAQELGCEFLAENSRQTGMYIAASMPKVVEGDDRPFNTTYVYGPAGLLGEYSKIHLISALGEDKLYQGGKTQLTVQLGEFRVSFFICYDLRFPQIFSTIAEQTDLYVVVANWPASRQTHWETLLAARAIENQAYVVGVNRVGQGGGLDFCGGSKVFSPKGEVIADGDDQQKIIVADLKLDEVSSWREQFKCLKDRQLIEA